MLVFIKARSLRLLTHLRLAELVLHPVAPQIAAPNPQYAAALGLDEPLCDQRLLALVVGGDCPR